MFHAFRCVFDYVEMCVGRIGFYPWCIYFCTSHVRAYFMHTYSLFSFLFVLLVMCFLSFSLSLSLSQIDCAWHLSANLPWLGTLLVQSLLLLILHPFFTFGSMMWRPSRTSLRTFRDMAFIRSATSFCRSFPTFLYLVSFGLEDGILFVRYS